MRLSICILGQLPPLGFCLLTGKFVLTLRHTNRLYRAEAYYSAALTGQIGPVPCTDGLHQVKTYYSTVWVLQAESATIYRGSIDDSRFFRLCFNGLVCT